jgi:hypothetical protein
MISSVACHSSEQSENNAMFRFLPASVLVAGLFVFAVRADEMEIPLEKVPAKAIAAVKKQFPGAKLIEATTDTVDGVTHYCVTLHHNKNSYDVTLTGDGKILEISREMEFKDLPKPVIAAFHKRFPKAKVEEVAELTEPGVKGKRYEIALITADGKEVIVEFDPEGKLLAEE